MVQAFKSEDAVEVRNFEGNSKTWIKGWIFGKLYEEKKNYGRARCYDSSGKAWSVSIDDIRIAKSELAITKKREQGSAQSLEQLVALGQQRGYKNPIGWARHLMAARGR